METQAIKHAPFSLKLSAGLVLGALGWVVLYSQLENLAGLLVRLSGIDQSTRLADAVQFFLYDTPKVLLLLTLIVFVMGVVHTFVSPERTRALLAGKRLGAGNVLAAGLGVATPFCSCSAIPLFIGLLSAGVPLGVTFSFLISAPMVNEVALGLLFAMFGWKVAALYLGLGLSIAIAAGLVIGELRMERHLEDWVRDVLKQTAQAALTPASPPSWEARFQSGMQHAKDIVGRVWPYLITGIAVGAGIHGYVPQDFLAGIMGKQAWWAVPAAVLIGVPMYSNAAGVIPVVEALLAKGAALGTVLAFMMSVIALSLPEMIILRKVLKPPLIGVFAGVVAVGILIVGYVFNLIL